MKKICIILCTFIIGFCASAEIDPYWGPGMFSLEGSLAEGNAIGGVSMDIGEFYFVESNTDLTLCLSPCRMDVTYDAEKADAGFSPFPWTVLSGYLVNAELSWNRSVGDYTLFSPFAGISAVNPADVTDITTECGLELSWKMPIEPFCNLSYPMFSKIISLSGGAKFRSTTDFFPEPFCSIGINLGICLWGVGNDKEKWENDQILH